MLVEFPEFNRALLNMSVGMFQAEARARHQTATNDLAWAVASERLYAQIEHRKANAGRWAGYRAEGVLPAPTFRGDFLTNLR